ncbi:MAG: methyl-accepting chemotaxis protein, partial [Acidovorax sp.]|nr:methyl-accepting chemotaxis protein [Acidovorax sp.]
VNAVAVFKLAHDASYSAPSAPGASYSPRASSASTLGKSPSARPALSKPKAAVAKAPTASKPAPSQPAASLAAPKSSPAPKAAKAGGNDDEWESF